MWESDATRITNGKQLMSTIGMYSFDSYIWNVYAIRDKITFTGYPTEDGSGSWTKKANRATGTATVSPTRPSGAAMRPWKTAKRSIRMSMR